MTGEKNIYGLTSGVKLLALCVLFTNCLLVAGCRSSDTDPSDPANKAANAKAASARGASAEAAGAVPGQPAPTPSVAPRSDVGQSDLAHRTSGQAEAEEADRPQPDHYDGGDAALYTAPIHRSGMAKEKVVKQAPSTPTPTPHTPIYRPLDAAGQPTDPKN